MIKLNNKSKITAIDQNNSTQSSKSENKKKTQPHVGSATRPKIVDAKVYKVKSAFVKILFLLLLVM